MSTLHPVALAGPMAVGKSTVAAALAAARGAPLLAFGDLIKREAQARGIGGDRASLQNLGQELYLSLGAAGMCTALLNGYDENVIIDGVRHVEVLQSLRAQRPGLVMAYLTAGLADLDNRWIARHDSTYRQQMATHAVESELNALRLMATVVIDTSAVAADVAAAAIDILARS